MFVLKSNESFAIFDARGNMWGRNEKDHDIADGLLRNDTRILSTFVLRLGGELPESISAAIDADNVLFQARMARGNIALDRKIFLWSGSLFESLTLKNTGAEPAAAHIRYDIAADFLDLFEIRGAVRAARGRLGPEERDGKVTRLTYRGLDHQDYVTLAVFSEALPPEGREWLLAPGEDITLYAKIGADVGTAIDAKLYQEALAAARGFMARAFARRPTITSSNPVFDQWVRQNAADIALLTTQEETGPYVYAGIPWYSTPFGRDGIITAWQLLWQDPTLAQGVLSLLARHQGTSTNAFHDSAPGKILHEIRRGEMARCGEIPHTPYYGTADATPLFVSLAGAYFARTGDIEFVKALWPHIERALHWIDRAGDIDGDGFIEYQRGAESGLGNQGWKDSQDSISHADGTLAAGPIALAEVQGYVYDAKKTAADIARVLDKPGVAARLDAEAAALKQKFNDVFWSEALGTYALALDGQKKPCLVLSSNPGHLLFSGIATPERAEKTATTLLSPQMFSGWGIRTLGAAEKRYEPSHPPEGYHNGTVWVHDTALCAAGMARYGMSDKAAAVLTALFEAAQHFPQMRLPELFGGLPRVPGTPPAPYPVACNPQAWASGAESLLLQSMLGLSIDGVRQTVTFNKPQLPEWLDTLTLQGLQIGRACLSVQIARQDDVTRVTVLQPAPGITVQMLP